MGGEAIGELWPPSSSNSGFSSSLPFPPGSPLLPSSWLVLLWLPTRLCRPRPPLLPTRLLLPLRLMDLRRLRGPIAVYDAAISPDAAIESVCTGYTHDGGSWSTSNGLCNGSPYALDGSLRLGEGRCEGASVVEDGRISKELIRDAQ